MKQLIITIAAVVLVVCVSNMSIYEAAEKGNIKAVKQHLAAGTDVNAKGEWEETPLHRAAAVGHKEITKLLITNGADVNAKDRPIGTPLDSAMKYKTTEIVDLLRKHGAKTGEELKAEGK